MLRRRATLVNRDGLYHFLIKCPKMGIGFVSQYAVATCTQGPSPYGTALWGGPPGPRPTPPSAPGRKPVRGPAADQGVRPTQLGSFRHFGAVFPPTQRRALPCRNWVRSFTFARPSGAGLWVRSVIFTFPKLPEENPPPFRPTFSMVNVAIPSSSPSNEGMWRIPTK